MPLRDYLCEACGNRQEELIRSADDEKDLSCAACGSRKLSRQLSVPAPTAGSCGSDGSGGSGFG